jgi:hypothetical protein
LVPNPKPFYFLTFFNFFGVCVCSNQILFSNYMRVDYNGCSE